MVETQDRLTISPTFESTIIVKGEAGLNDLLRIVRYAWKSGTPVIINSKEVRFELDKEQTWQRN